MAKKLKKKTRKKVAKKTFKNEYFTFANMAVFAFVILSLLTIFQITKS